MAWALQFDGDSYCQAASFFNAHNTAEFVTKYVAVFPTSSVTTEYVMIGRSTNFHCQLRVISGGVYGQLFIRFSNSSSSETVDLNKDLNTGSAVEIKLTRSAGTLNVYIDGDLIATRINSFTGNPPNNIGASQALGFITPPHDFISYEVYSDISETNLTFRLSADDSVRDGGTDQPVLTDTVAANNATGVNFPSFDPSVWIDLGGGAITVNDTTATTKANSNSDSILPVGAFNVLDNTTSTNTKSNSDFIQLAAVVSINDSLTTSKSSSNADVIVNVGAFNILDSTATTKTKSNQDSIQFGAAVFVSDSVATSKSKSNSDSVLLVGQFFISDAAVTSKSSAGGDLVYLSSTVSISDSITTTKSNTNNDLVLFVGEFNVTDTVAATKSNSNNDIVSLVGEFIVLDSTATTKTDNNRDGVIIGEIVVSFNPETNYTQLFLSTTYTQPDLSRNYSQVFLSTNYSQ